MTAHGQRDRPDQAGRRRAPLKTHLRANLQAARDEILALQAGKADTGHDHTLSDVSAAGVLAARDVVDLGDLTSNLAYVGTILGWDSAGGPTRYSAGANLTIDAVTAQISSASAPEPSVVTISGTAHMLASDERAHRNILLLVDNGNQDCTITVPGTAGAGAWRVRSRTTGTITVHNQGDTGSVNGASSIATIGPGKEIKIEVESNPGAEPVTTVEGETTEEQTLDGHLNGNGAAAVVDDLAPEHIGPGAASVTLAADEVATLIARHGGAVRVTKSSSMVIS